MLESHRIFCPGNPEWFTYLQLNSSLKKFERWMGHLKKQVFFELSARFGGRFYQSCVEQFWMSSYHTSKIGNWKIRDYSPRKRTAEQPRTWKSSRNDKGTTKPFKPSCFGFQPLVFGGCIVSFRFPIGWEIRRVFWPLMICLASVAILGLPVYQSISWSLGRKGIGERKKTTNPNESKKAQTLGIYPSTQGCKSRQI